MHVLSCDVKCIQWSGLFKKRISIEDIVDHLAGRKQMSNLHKGARIITQFPLSFQTLIRQLGGIINQDLIGVFYQHMIISHVQSEGSRLDVAWRC